MSPVQFTKLIAKLESFTDSQIRYYVKPILLSAIFTLFLSSCGGDSTQPPADSTPPVITLFGDANMTHEQGTTYSDPGATATDDVDGNVDVVVSGAVDAAIAATYTLTLKVYLTSCLSAGLLKFGSVSLRYTF